MPNLCSTPNTPVNFLFGVWPEVGMGQNEKLFTDGEAYERRIGRWSRLVGEKFLDWLAVPEGLRWLDVILNQARNNTATNR